MLIAEEGEETSDEDDWEKGGTDTTLRAQRLLTAHQRVTYKGAEGVLPFSSSCLFGTA